MDLDQHYLPLQNTRSGLRWTAEQRHTVAPEFKRLRRANTLALERFQGPGSFWRMLRPFIPP